MNGSATASASLGRRIDLRTVPSGLVTARRVVDAAARRFGLDEHGRYAFTFAVNEAVSNAIEHGRPSPDGTIRMNVGEEADTLVFCIEDDGSFAPKAPRHRDAAGAGPGPGLHGRLRRRGRRHPRRERHARVAVQAPGRLRKLARGT